MVVINLLAVFASNRFFVLPACGPPFILLLSADHQNLDDWTRDVHEVSTGYCSSNVSWNSILRNSHADMYYFRDINYYLSLIGISEHRAPSALRGFRALRLESDPLLRLHNNTERRSLLLLGKGSGHGLDFILFKSIRVSARVCCASPTNIRALVSKGILSCHECLAACLN